MSDNGKALALYKNIQKVKELEGRLDKAMEVIKAVSHIGVDWGCGKYELENKFIDQARELYESDDSAQEPALEITSN